MASIFLDFAEWDLPTSEGVMFCTPETQSACSNPGLDHCYGWTRTTVGDGLMAVVDDNTHPKVWRRKSTRLIYTGNETSRSVRPLSGNWRPAANEYYMSVMVKFGADHIATEYLPIEYKVNRAALISGDLSGLQFGGSSIHGKGYDVDVDNVLQGAVYGSHVLVGRADWPVDKWMLIENYLRLNSEVGVADGICSGRVTVLDGETRDVIYDDTNSAIEYSRADGELNEFVRFAWLFSNVSNGGVWPPGGVGGDERTVFLASPYISANPDEYDIRCDGGPPARPRSPTNLR